MADTKESWWTGDDNAQLAGSLPGGLMVTAETVEPAPEDDPMPVCHPECNARWVLTGIGGCPFAAPDPLLSVARDLLATVQDAGGHFVLVTRGAIERLAEEVKRRG